ncbi:MAG TPA: MlaD family protein [Myxococcota bacterium]|nr:MlaD family protein [Myxococcota bacterium]
MARALKTRVIAFVAIAAVLLLALVWWVGDFSLSRRDDLLVDFGYTGALQVGGPVRVSGVNVGKVQDIRFLGAGETPEVAERPSLGQTLPPLVRVRMTVDHDLHGRLRRDAMVYVAMQGFIGESYVEISPGTASEALVTGRAVRGVDAPRLHVVMLQAGYALEVITTLLSQFLPAETLRSDGVAAKSGGSGSGDFFAALTELVRGNSQNVGKLLDEHVALAGDLRVVVARVREATENGELATLLDNGNAVAVVLRRELPHILERTQTSLDDLHVLASSLKSSAVKAPEIVARVDQMTQAMQLTVADVQAMVHNVRRGEGTIGGFVNDAQIYDDVKELMRDLRRNPWKFFWRD